MAFRQQNEWTEFLRRYAAELQGRLGRAAVVIDRARTQPKQILDGRGAEGKAFHRQRDAWTGFLRGCAAELRGHIVRRFWGPAVRARFRVCVLIGWCGFAATLLIVSLVVHVSTFLGIDPMAKWPGVMFIHLAIFPPFIAAIYYAERTSRKGREGQDKVFKSAPLWLRTLAGVFFAYALVNFAVFLILNEGGGPHERDGKYVLTSHGTVLRELSKAEYHRQQAYVVRGFSGHWMMFSCAALTMLVGTAKLHRHSRNTGVPGQRNEAVN
jgi:hypothetical protein